MFNKFLAGVIATCLFFSCQNNETSINKFSDPVLVKIYDLKDRRLSDSLYQFFASENALYRKEAVLAFASIQDSVATDNLAKTLLMDGDSTVRKAAAFAIGQTASSHSERLLLGALVKEKNHEVFRELLEAYGKATTHWQLVQPDLLHDTTKATGFAWSLYRAALNGKADASVLAAAATLLDNKYNTITRLGVAHFFAKTTQDLHHYEHILINALEHDNSTEVVMAIALALKKINHDASLHAIRKILTSTNDYRVVINAIKALQPYSLNDTKSLLYPFLHHKNINIAIQASEVIKANAAEEHWIELSNFTNRIQNWRVKANIFEAALKSSDNKLVREEIQTAYLQSYNPYEKAALIQALQHSVSSLGFIEEQLFKADTPVVKLSAATCLVDLNRKKNIDASLQTRFASIYTRAIEIGDAGIIGTIAGAISDPKLNYKNIIKDVTFLQEARKKLSLPKDYEAIQPLEDAIAYIGNSSRPAIKNDYNHPLDWELIKSIPTNQLAVIKTNRGHIKIKLLVEDAPGAVSNFVKLSKQGYFNQKFFHRVVPNFVVQAGCNRGDGWGSEDYSIRSEFSPRKYKTGSVGMASAGKDTEGTQWFITHSPTPHLDGRYTIFAEVIEGMDVVDLLQVSDQILEVVIPKTKN
jgi:cyclophilin family peptidyl-prolyl cis-trans isomerase